MAADEHINAEVAILFRAKNDRRYRLAAQVFSLTSGNMQLPAIEDLLKVVTLMCDN